MTYKKIIMNMIDCAARKALEAEFAKILLDFGTVKIVSEGKDYKDFIVEIHEIDKPWNYEILGYISDLGFIEICRYRIQGAAKAWSKFNMLEVQS